MYICYIKFKNIYNQTKNTKMDKSINNKESIYNAKKELFDEIEKFNEKNVSILRGCPNQSCFCTGKCKEIVGYRERVPGEIREIL